MQLKIRIRSRQQRVRERRNKAVKTKEEKLWEKVSAEMMSEQETDHDGDENGFIRHQPSWRSEKFNDLITKLDKRVEKSNKRSLARKCTYCNSIEKEPPSMQLLCYGCIPKIQMRISKNLTKLTMKIQILKVILMA